MTAVSLWGIILFAFQNAFLKIDTVDKRLYLISAFLIFVFVANMFYLAKYVDGIHIPENVFWFVDGGILAVAVLFIYFLNNLNLNRNSIIARLFIYTILFGAAFLAQYLSGETFPVNISFSIFLGLEIIFLVTGSKKNITKSEMKLLVITYSAMIAMNVTDIFLVRISLHYGVWVLPLFIVFYGIVKYKDNKEKLRDQIVLLKTVEKKEKESYFTSINMIVSLLESKNDYLKGHSEKVSFYSTLLGMKAGLTHDECEELSVAALLHDIGYVGVPMDKYTRMNIINLADIQKIRYHPVIGAEILRKSSLFSKYADIILYHHENWNGTGYPFGLSGNQIPFYSRIIQIADTFDSLTTDRFYRTALNKHDALLIIRSGKGQDFDPHLSEMFIECLK